MKNIIFVPIKDYFISRKKVFIKFLIPILIALIALLLSMFFNIGNSEKVISTFSGFIDTQINIVAILISFSVAIITILVSADNKNIQCLKETESNKKQYKPVNGRQLSLFQILLSNIAYNAIIEIIFSRAYYTFSRAESFADYNIEIHYSHLYLYYLAYIICIA